MPHVSPSSCTSTSGKRICCANLCASACRSDIRPIKPATAMRQARRVRHVLEVLDQSTFASVDELVTALDASPATVRRDLRMLESDGRLRRTHGGAKSTDIDRRLHGTPFTKDVNFMTREMSVIAKAAAAMCSTGADQLRSCGSGTAQRAIRAFARSRRGDFLRAEYRRQSF